MTVPAQGLGGRGLNITKFFKTSAVRICIKQRANRAHVHDDTQRYIKSRSVTRDSDPQTPKVARNTALSRGREGRSQSTVAAPHLPAGPIYRLGSTAPPHPCPVKPFLPSAARPQPALPPRQSLHQQPCPVEAPESAVPSNSSGHIYLLVGGWSEQRTQLLERV